MSAETEWPFEDAKNTAVITTTGVSYRHEAVCLVSHDDDDGGWQFLTGSPVTMADAMVVSLVEVISRDRSLLELADLPLGWQATRENPQSPWRRSQKTSD